METQNYQIRRASPFASDFDFNDPLMISDPYLIYKNLRESHSVFFSESMNAWVLMNYTDVDHALKNRQLLTGPIPELGTYGPYVKDALQDSMLFNDPPTHNRLRKVVAKSFTPKAILKLEPKIQNLCDELLNAIDCREFDFIKDFAYPLPLQVICRMIGISTKDFKTFYRWSVPLAKALDSVASPEERMASDQAMMEMEQYIENLIHERRAQPQDDLISDMLQLENDSLDLNEKEFIRTFSGLFFAGHETTVNLLGNGLYQLLLHPEQLEKLIENPELIEIAIEEMVRFDTPAQFAARYTAEEITIKGQVIPAKSIVMCCIGSANRDPEAFTDPDRFNIERNPKNLSFGGGIHVCLGMHLAKLEAKIGLQSFLKKFPNVRLGDQKPIIRPVFSLRGFSNLAIKV